MVIGTICAANHLPKAACLAKSLIETQPKHIFVLCLVERDYSTIRGLEAKIPKMVLASDIGVSSFNSFIFRHERYEACCAVKAHFLLWLMRQFPEEQNFLYLDPDVMVYSRFEELEALIERPQGFAGNQIVVTPHQVEDETSRIKSYDNTFRILIAGTFNLGFLAIRRSQTASEFLKWWDSKLKILCYMDWRSRGLFVDQKWALLGLSFFDMTVLREPGYNVANWNVSSRHISPDGKGGYLVNERPLRFFHFSNLDSDRDLYFLKRCLDTSSFVFKLRDRYLEELGSLGFREYARIPWSYDTFLSGAPIHPEVRSVYKGNLRLQYSVPDPFAECNARFYSIYQPSPQNDGMSRRRKQS